MRNKIGLAVIALACMTGMAHAGVIVSETFDTDGAIADYTGAGEIFSGTIMDAATTSGVVANGVLTMSVSGGTSSDTGFFAARIGLDGTQTLVSMSMDVIGVSYNAASAAFQLYSGSFASVSDFQPNWNPSGNGRNWSKTVLAGGSPYAVNNYADDGTTYSQPGHVIGTAYTWSVFLNQSGSAQDYTAPDGATQTLATDAWAMYIDDTLVGTNITKGTQSSDATDLQGLILNVGRNWYGGSSTTSIDNIVVRDDLNMYVPEPATMGLMALGGVALIKRRRK